MNSIDAVAAGVADIAGIDHSVWNARLAADPQLRELRVLGTTRDWPAPPISIRSTMPDALRHELTNAIMKLARVKPADSSDYAFMLAEAKDHPTWP